MNKTFKGFVCGMAVIALALLPACRTKKTPAPVVQPAVATSAPPPVVEPPPAPTTVATDTDFVRPDVDVKTETLPSDIDDANRVAHERGYIQDAYFGYDEATLSTEAQAALSASAEWLRRNPQYSLLIEGHCDERGTEQYNLALGDRRANTAKDYLSTLGVDAGRIRTVSYGEERPFDPGHDDSSWAKNRRDHLVLVGK